MRDKAKEKRVQRSRRHLRVRRKVQGTAEVPRLCVFRSNRHIYAQVIDDDRGVTLAAASTLKVSGASVGAGKVGVAREVGKAVAEAALEAGVKAVRFDRGGYLYLGRVAALADGARKAGLEF